MDRSLFLRFSQMCSTAQNRQTNLFQRANTIENQLTNLSQRIGEIQRVKSKLTDSHLNNERKLQQITGMNSTISTDENHERLILIQVNHQDQLFLIESPFLPPPQTVLENLNENDVDLRELADTIDHLQPKITEFLHEFQHIQTEQERLTHQAKVNDLTPFSLRS